MTASSDDSTISASTTRSGCLPNGYRLREFRIERVLGEGGFGVVYEATDTRLERRIAIKEYMPAALATRDADFSVHPRSSADLQEAFVAGLRSFVNEAKLLARFEHPALIKVYQFWEEKGTAYMVMPFYAAPTFKQWIRERRPLPEPWLVNFLDRIIDAVDALHRENCLHRDVAPDNVLVLNDATPLLLDFGAARRVIGDLTHALTAILKPGFAPIEQYAESTALRQGPWTDVYSLAAVGRFAILGKVPPAAVSRMVRDDMEPLRTAAAGRYSDRLLAALDAGLVVRPEQRPASMAALRALIFGEDEVEVGRGDDSTVLAQSELTMPAPAALHSTFKPTADANDADRTRELSTLLIPQSGAPTVPSAPTPARTRPTAARSTQAPMPAGEPSSFADASGRSHYGALAWAALYAALGAAIVVGLSWWFSPAPRVAPPPVAAVPPSVPPPAPAIDVPVAPAAPVSPVAAVDAPPKSVVETPAPRRSEPSVAEVKKLERAPAPAIAEKPPAPAVRPTEPAKKAPTSQVADAQKSATESRPAPVQAAPPPSPQPLRAPAGPPPLEVSDSGIAALQVPGTVKPDDKEPRFAGFTCCNLHYSGDWVSDLNYSSYARIPAGTPIKITDYGRWRIAVEIDGKKMRIGLDYGRRQETLAQYARKLTVDRDLRFRMASFPAVVQDAIGAGKLLPGMSKEQVLMAVGFPARHETASVNDTKWKLWHTSRVPYYVTFDDRGRVKEIEIDPAQRASVVFELK